MVFSPLLKSLFGLPHDLKLTASAYHDPKILPPYLAITIQPKGKDFAYQLLLNLDTLDPVRLLVHAPDGRLGIRLWCQRRHTHQD